MAQPWGRGRQGEKAPEISWYIFSHQTPCINFSLKQKRKLFWGGYHETGTYINVLWLQIMSQIKGGRHSSIYSGSSLAQTMWRLEGSCSTAQSFWVFGYFGSTWKPSLCQNQCSHTESSGHRKVPSSSGLEDKMPIERTYWNKKEDCLWSGRRNAWGFKMLRCRVLDLITIWF